MSAKSYECVDMRDCQEEARILQQPINPVLIEESKDEFLPMRNEPEQLIGGVEVEEEKEVVSSEDSFPSDVSE
jgi:hypothetical protein